MPTKSKTPQSAITRQKLGQILIKANAISADNLESALAAQKTQKEKIGQILINAGVVDDVAVAQALAKQFDMRFVRLSGTVITPEAITSISPQLAHKHNIVGYQKDADKITVALDDPLNHSATDDLRFIIQKPITLVLASQSDIKNALVQYYGLSDQKKDSNRESDGDEQLDQKAAQNFKDNIPDIQNLEGLAPIVKLSSAIFADAISKGASDVHIEPSGTSVTIRCRIDGIMYKTKRIDLKHHKALVSRIKVISKLDISEHRKPQDGKAQIKFENQLYDLRISTIPTSYGEKATIRILDPKAAQMRPENLGFGTMGLKHILDAIRMPQGIVLVTGPTGSGKSSTLYACINEINKPSVNIITVEDPVEYDVAGINQVQINPKAGISFASGLRSILRQDPDIVMVGEIRDRETAAIAFEAAQTGHLVLSTLHTNDAPSAATRLLDLGVKDFLISEALVLVIGQRLVRKICPNCKTPFKPSPDSVKSLRPHLDPGQKLKLFSGKGCNSCHNTGYAGRLGIFETFVVSPPIRKLIKPEVSAHILKKAARKDGFQSMNIDGIQKALAGLTTIDEILRVVPPEKSSPEDEKPETLKAPQTPKPASHPDPPFKESTSTQKPQKKAAQPKDKPQPARTAPLVLVVDDDVVTRMRLRNALEEKGLLAVTLNDGDEALAFINQTLPDLIVTDLYMPNLNGIELIKKIRDNPSSSAIPIIMLTAEDDEESEIRVIEAGADDYLTKPVNFKRLLARVDRFVSTPLKVLVVDDDKTTRRVLSVALAEAKIMPITAANAVEATRMIVREKPDLIITDYSMPDANGVALIRTLKSRIETRDIPIIMLTARDEVDLEVQALQLGADDYLTKPVQRTKLLARVQRLIKRHKKN
jgi:type IV pilus assembly protein PilB